MSREFEVTSEIDLPAAPDDVRNRDHGRTRGPGCSRTGMEHPRTVRCRPTGKRGRSLLGTPPPASLSAWSRPDGTFNALDYAYRVHADGGTR